MIDKRELALRRAGGLLLLSLGYLTLLSQPTSAGDPLHSLFGCPVPDRVGNWCCDDYRPKQAPCTCAPLCFGCDDYCGKKAPCVCAPLSFCCDDYCEKCPPKVCSRPICQVLKCGSPARGCNAARCDEVPPRHRHEPRQAEIKERSQGDDDPQLRKQPPAFPPVIVQDSNLSMTK